MSPTLEKARAHYAGIQEQARRRAVETLRAAGFELGMRAISNKAFEQIDEVWTPCGRVENWNWREICYRYRDPKMFTLAIWDANDLLIGVALATLTKTYATIQYVEGSPVEGCKYRGKRLVFALEAVANYAQGAGVSELRIDPKNETLATLYQNTYGFSLASPAKGAPYWYKKVA